MILTPGAHVGPYEIQASVGAGGMGEVYRARDARLGRDVAIKVLPAAFASDADRLQRFEQEARAAAALEHPNILAVHDVGQHEGTPYIVSELLDGQTLAARLAEGPLPVRKAIEYAVHIAKGLAAAHDKGVVHRDLKPDNIFLTTDERLKILDFGLAKLTQPEPMKAGATSLPTTRVWDEARWPHTGAGTVLGTVGYMAPEQVRGLSVDNRSDIFALGAVLHEMITGKRAFTGVTTMDVMTAILKDDPPPLPRGEREIPPALERIVTRCLEKAPAARFKSADDLAFALESLSASAIASSVWSNHATSARHDRRLIWAGGLLLALAVAIPFAITRLRTAPEAAVPIRFGVFPPQEVTLPGSNVGGQAIAFSPNGRHIVFRGVRQGGLDSLWIHSLESSESKALPGTEGGERPFWSPDNRFLAFFAQGKLKKVDISGGSVQTLCDAPAGLGGTWGRDGVIVFAPSPFAALSQVSADGGQPVPATKLDSALKEASHEWPDFLPGGRRFLYHAMPGNVVKLGSLDGDQARVLLPAGIASSRALYASPGFLLFVRAGGSLTARVFDPSRAELTGDSVPVAERVRHNPNTGQAAFSVSENGLLAYWTTSAAESQLVWLTRDGKPRGSFRARADLHSFSLAADERRAVVEQIDVGGSDLWVFDQARANETRFTFDQGTAEGHPIWSPDDSRIVFFRGRPGLNSTLLVQATNSAKAEPVVETTTFKQATDWSPKGQLVIFEERNRETGWDLKSVAVDGDRSPNTLVASRFDERFGQLSPEGNLLAYVSNETGRQNVYIVSFPNPDGSRKWKISTAGGTKPRWRRDGRELFFIDDAGMLMSVTVPRARDVEPGVPQPLFEARVAESDGWNYAVSADGQRVLVMRNTGAPPPITVVTNWVAGSRR